MGWQAAAKPSVLRGNKGFSEADAKSGEGDGNRLSGLGTWEEVSCFNVRQRSPSRCHKGRNPEGGKGGEWVQRTRKIGHETRLYGREKNSIQMESPQKRGTYLELHIIGRNGRGSVIP